MRDEQFVEVYTQWAPLVLGYCAFRTGSRLDAEDLAEETFLRLLEKGTGLTEEHRGPWLMKVARNLCTDRLRTRGRELPILAVEPAGVTEEPVWLDEGVRSGLASLNPMQAQIVYLRVVRDLPYSEIGRLTRRSEASARVTYHRAIARVRTTLEEVGSWPATSPTKS